MDSAAAADAERQLLRDYLSAFDAICPRCRYSLRALASDRCPECGQQLTLRLRLAEPCRGAFVVGLVGLGVGIGASAVPLAFAGVMTAAYGAVPPWVRDGVLAPALILGVLLVLAVVWCRGYGRVRRLGKKARATLAAACWIVSVPLAAAAVASFMGGL